MISKGVVHKGQHVTKDLGPSKGARWNRDTQKIIFQNTTKE